MSRSSFPPVQPHQAQSPQENTQRSRGIQKTAFIAVITNAFLATGQIIIGLMAHSFSLVADAAHTFSDMVTDLFVLIAGRHGGHPADHDHPYGHARIETVTSLLLGAILTGVGFGFLWSSGIRLQNMENLPPLQPIALVMALFTLLAKEVLFRYMLRESRRLHAPILEASAWHARSDAASSLVVAVGIGGSLIGYPFLEPLGAAVVGFLIVHMGIKLGWKAIRELIDTGLSAEETAKLRETICATPGVIGLHDLRTRRMASRVLCDAHVQVTPKITVSEGHHISDSVYFRVRKAHPEVQDVLVHIDPEDDTLNPLPSTDTLLPERDEVLKTIHTLSGLSLTTQDRVQIHYLNRQIEVEVLLAKPLSAAEQTTLNEQIRVWIKEHPVYRSISFFTRYGS